MVAVYYDVENLMEYKNYELAISKVKKIVANLEAIQFAYAEWGRFDNASRELFVSNGIGMKQVINGVGYYANIKNISDITITVDVMEILFKNAKIDHFILVSGDGGFIPLVLKLREYGKRVSIVTSNKNMSKNIISYINDYFVIDTETKDIVQKNIAPTFKAIAVAVDDKEIYEKIWSIMTNSKSPSATARNIFKNATIKSFIKGHESSYDLLEEIYQAVNSKKPNNQQLFERFITHLKKRINTSLASTSTIKVQSDDKFARDEDEIKPDNQEVDMQPQQEYEHYQKTIWAIMCNSKSGQEAVTNIFKSKEIESRIQEHGLSSSYLKKTYYKTCYNNPKQMELSQEFREFLNQKIKLSYSKKDGLIVPKIKQTPLSNKDVRDICKKNGLSFSVSDISDTLFLEIIQNKNLYMALNQEDMKNLLIQNTKRSSVYVNSVIKTLFLLDEDKRLTLSAENYQSLLSGAVSFFINSASKHKAQLNKIHIANMIGWSIS